MQPTLLAKYQDGWSPRQAEMFEKMFKAKGNNLMKQFDRVELADLDASKIKKSQSDSLESHISGGESPYMIRRQRT